MAAGGFTFGQTGTGTTTATTLGGSSGFSFGAPKTTAATGTAGGFTLGAATPQTTSATPSLGGFSFGAASAKPATTTASAGLFGSLGGTNTATTAASTGFSLGGLGGTAATTTASTGLSFGGLGGTKTTTPSTGLLGGALAGGSTGFGLGGATATPSTGFSLGGTTTTATAGGLTLGGLLSTTTTTASTGLAGASTGSIFSAGNAANNAASKGLGGVDPKTSSTSSGTTTANGKPSDTKAAKETPMPDLLVQTVEDFKKHIKDQKSVREDIARMSPKCMYKVQEDVVALKQLLSVVSNGLQRNAAAIDKLKWEAAQELHNSEMAHRTKDIPAGLQYENTAPTEYYHRLVEDFEQRMQTYRQQIETMESHLACLHQPNKMSPQELVLLLRKIHETFLALAAQLHQVHEAVKTQKEHYLNYRKVFHADDKNIFEKYKKPTSQPLRRHPAEIGGPNPFTGLSSAAAAAMASAINRVQDPTGAPPAVGLGTSGLTGGQIGSLTGGQSGGLFAAAGGSSTGFGFGNQSLGFSFNTPSSTAAKPLGTSLFGNLSTGNTSGFGLGTTQQTPPTGTATPIPGGTGGAPVENKLFFLSKPPVKRGKR